MNTRSVGLGLAASACALALGALGCSHETSRPPMQSPPALRTAVGPRPGPGNFNYDAPNPVGDGPVTLADGRKWFNRYNCSGCHGDHAGGGMGPSLRDSTWMYGSTNQQIFASIAEGRAHGMPAWGTKVPESQIWEIVAYIRSLRTAHEPEPPS